MNKDKYFELSYDFNEKIKKKSLSEIQDLNHPLNFLIPKHLYKYRRVDKVDRIEFYLNKRKIYTASFNSLNDPFEGITNATKEMLLKHDHKTIFKEYKTMIVDLLVDKVESLNKTFALKIYQLILDNDFNEKKIYESSISFVDKKDRKSLKTIISLLIYIFSNVSSEEDKNKDLEEGIKILINTNTLIGAYCMCESGTNEQLWAAYADNYEGYCIEYDFSKPCKSKGSVNFIKTLFPVIYKQIKDDDWLKVLFETMIKSMDIYGNPNRFNGAIYFKLWFIKVICTKTKNRFYEKERRFIDTANRKIQGPLISRVIVGHNIKKENFDIIKKYCDKNSYPIAITDLDNINKRVIIRDINEEDIMKINGRC